MHTQQYAIMSCTGHICVTVKSQSVGTFTLMITLSEKERQLNGERVYFRHTV